MLLLAHAALGPRCLAATVDHGLRAAAASEAREAAALCARLGVQHDILTGPLPARVGRSANVSARARALRYDLLSRHAAAVEAPWIATAHHADDQLETMLLRLNRGVGVAGLASARGSGWRVARPLLGWRRAELAGIVADAGVRPADDPSNRDGRYDRARLRATLGPTDWLNPAGLRTSAAALAEADEALRWATQALLATRVVETDEQVTLDPRDIPAELLRRIVLGCVRRVDPAAAPDGPTLGRALAGLLAERPVTIGAVAIRPGARWSFAPAPPRRSG